MAFIDNTPLPCDTLGMLRLLRQPCTFAAMSLRSELFLTVLAAIFGTFALRTSLKGTIGVFLLVAVRSVTLVQGRLAIFFHVGIDSIWCIRSLYER